MSRPEEKRVHKGRIEDYTEFFFFIIRSVTWPGLLCCALPGISPAPIITLQPQWVPAVAFTCAHTVSRTVAVPILPDDHDCTPPSPLAA